ncbi:MAG: complex I NDUFA9 subunit family protein [Gammaproteobacteria bacterium]|nr:complex I NDUFA9 subunit family protein [Gammaproteobacteria bacterium]
MNERNYSSIVDIDLPLDGNSTMRKKKICILGGNGFVGQQIIRQLNPSHRQVRVLSRSANRADSAHVEYIQADVHDQDTLIKYFKDTDAVINLVGILNEQRDNGEGFYQAHVELTQKVVRACQASNTTRLLHMSALNAADDTSTSFYLRTKGEAEHYIFSATGLDVTVFRPSVIFGQEDSFTNRFAGLLQQIPLFFPLACANARFAPVYVGDVAKAYVKALEMPETFMHSYNLCGPQTYTLQEIVIYLKELLKLKRLIIPLNSPLSRMQAEMMEYVPGKPFSRDNFRSLQIDSICCEQTNTLESVFGIKPTALEDVVPEYLLKK